MCVTQSRVCCLLFCTAALRIWYTGNADGMVFGEKHTRPVVVIFIIITHAAAKNNNTSRCSGIVNITVFSPKGGLQFLCTVSSHFLHHLPHLLLPLPSPFFLD